MGSYRFGTGGCTGIVSWAMEHCVWICANTLYRPFMFDKPVEEGVEWVFHKILGPGEASGHHMETKKEL
jgi:hypothetical protein